ncbi:MAG: GNAT family N-acetyltransferase [Acidimicrobiales bacterium]
MGGGRIGAVVIRPLGAEDRSWMVSALTGVWGSTLVARDGQLIDAAGLPGLVALSEDRRIGLVTLSLVGRRCEVVTLQVEQEGRGVGRALMAAATTTARAWGATMLWLVTTNDNGRAIALYEGLGLELVELRVDGVAASRAVKPSIPLVRADGTPVRDELVYAVDVAGTAPG